MINEINAILLLFRDCFSRSASFKWIVIAVTGFIVRLDHHGITSTVRWLSLDSSHYGAFLKFFRASSWRLSALHRKWLEIVSSQCPPITVAGRALWVGDGIKISKEAEKMPGMKRLHQESDNSGKSPFINGHHFGVIGTLAGLADKVFCIPLRAELHECVAALRELQNKPAPVVNGSEKVSMTTLMASMAVDLAAGLTGGAILVLDAYFSVGPVFLVLKAATDSGGKRLIHLVTRAKSNVVAYEDPPPKTGGRGRPRKYGAKLKLYGLFAEMRDRFEEATVEIYNRRKTIRFLTLDLVWKPIEEKVRFVLIIDGEQCFVLMCSDLTLSPEDILRAYGYRFKIEVAFKVLKHLIGVFSYHFWTREWSGNKKGGTSDATENSDTYSGMLIEETLNAIEGFVNFGCIATGILQILSIRFPGIIWKRYRGWLRTVSSAIPSEETVKLVVQQEYYQNFRSFKNTATYRIIMSKLRKPLKVKLPRAA
ncbi:MAG: transposase [Proteobacteria bacterium]|nr:transposase [Pseudomonadota bacterium]